MGSSWIKGSNPCFLHWQGNSYHCAYREAHQYFLIPVISARWTLDMGMKQSGRCSRRGEVVRNEGWVPQTGKQQKQWARLALGQVSSWLLAVPKPVPSTPPLQPYLSLVCFAHISFTPETPSNTHSHCSFWGLCWVIVAGWAFSNCCEPVYSLVAICGLLTWLTSLVVEHGP